MIFSLQRRFLLLLLLPVALILSGVGVAGFFFVRTYLLEQWVASTRLTLEKAALEVHKQLNDKIELINLIAKSDPIPNGRVTQAFLIQELIQKKGVRFVDVIVNDGSGEGQRPTTEQSEGFGADIADGLYTMELCGDVGFCAPTMDPNAMDRSLRIVKTYGGQGVSPLKTLLVRVSFDALMDPVRDMGLSRGSSAKLVTSTGQILAETDKSMRGRNRLGETGDALEKQILDGIRKNRFGTIFGPGHPPEVVAGFHSVPFINWYLILYSRGEEILGPIVTLRYYYGISGVTAIVVILLLIRFTTRSVATSVGRISEAALKVQEGNYAVSLPEAGNDEIAQLSRSFNKMVEGLEQRDRIERTFGRYVDKQFAAELMKRPDALHLGGRKRTVTIMIADLRNFTSFAEQLPPEEVIAILNRYFARMIAIIDRYRGIIVDFFGDSILVFFDGMNAAIERKASDAVQCAVEMQQEHEGFVAEIREEGLPELRMGIGIHTGPVIVGNIGAETRAKYGIVGSDVNLTSRIQSTASGGKIVISKQTYDLLRDKVRVSPGFRVCLKGVGGDRELFEVESFDGSKVEEFVSR
ncbi:MAG: adenylate/guanylate cyclase domain-containing protein [Pseudomonadota bacterium]